jgi:aspartyl-tRNA(Asn)/glutamyl-tRNA(Gln) amidotransferase subunit C
VVAAISPQEVEHIAELAKLQLSDEEKALYSGQLSAILDYFNRLQQLDTDGVPPMTSALPLNNVLRDDLAEACLPTEKLLANAPDAEDEMFRVSAVLD